MAAVFSLAEMHLRSTWNWRSVYVGRVIEPLAYLVFLIAGLGGLVSTVEFRGTSLSFAVFAVPGLLALISVRSGNNAVSDFSNDRKWGVFAFARSGGVSTLQYLGSLALAALPVALLQSVGVFGLSILLVDNVPVGSLAFTMATIFPASIATWVFLGTAIGALVRNYSQRDLILSLSSLPLVFAAPLFYSLEEAPRYLQMVSLCNPLTYVAQALRGGVSGTITATDVGVVIGFLVASATSAFLAIERSELLATER